jgi:hypothetical protein
MLSEILVRKQTEDGQLLSFDGLLSHFQEKCPDSLKQIESTDICLIEVHSDVNPQEIAQLFDFVGTSQMDVDYQELEKFEVFSPDDDIQIPGVIRRAAIIIYPECGTQFELIGLEHDSKIILFAMKPPYLCSYLYEWFGEANTLAYNFWFSEGPGPVSWEGEFALFKLDDYLLSASDGDSVEDFSIVKLGDHIDFANAILNWLQDHGTFVQFVLKTMEPKWADPKLKSRLKAALAEVEERESLALNLTPDQISKVLEKAETDSSFPDANLIQLLDQENYPKVLGMLEYVESVARGVPGFRLNSFGDFLERF